MTHAQDIYRAAFNNAWQQRIQSGELDEVAGHSIAWGAVTRQYRKAGSVWVRRSEAAGALW
jgi:cation transport regulator